MKLPQQTKRHCPYCKKHTLHKVDTAKQKARNAAHPMSRWATSRVQSRGLRVGTGNKGKFSKRPPAQRKLKSKVTKRITIIYKCKECGKIKGIKKAIRTGRIQIGEKVAK
jgi:large subunit ribosomal protein L44e